MTSHSSYEKVIYIKVVQQSRIKHCNKLKTQGMPRKNFLCNDVTGVSDVTLVLWRHPRLCILLESHLRKWEIKIMNSVDAGSGNLESQG
jgi:hypothetical protein